MINKEIGQRIAWLRKEVCAMTQAEFAKALGIAFPHTISEYEHGTFLPSTQRCKALIKLAAQHGHEITYEWLRPDIYAD